MSAVRSNLLPREPAPIEPHQTAPTQPETSKAQPRKAAPTSRPEPILKLQLIVALLAASLCQLQPLQARRLASHRSYVQHTHDPSGSRSASNQTNLNDLLRLRFKAAQPTEIPGLYDTDGHITPIQGKSQFYKTVLGVGQEGRGSAGQCGDSNLTDAQKTIEAAARTETISLVQFYMASCPDCQGFSPYFKRFAADIGPHWRRLVRIYTVNCNDLINIHLCQEENPRLVVPMVRWYVFPSIQRDALQDRADRQFNYPDELLNIAHRQFIHRQWRDLISLRRATLRFIALTLDELGQDPQRAKVRHGSRLRRHQREVSPRQLFYESLPAAWHQLGQLGRSLPDDVAVQEQFVADLHARNARCLEAVRLETCEAGESADPSDELLVDNFVVFEDRPSFIGRTVVADWSSMACRRSTDANNKTRTILVHRSADLDLLTGTELLNQTAGATRPILATFHYRATDDARSPIQSVDELDISVITPTKAPQPAEGGRLERPRRAALRPRLERVQQRALLEEYYSRPSGGFVQARQPNRHAATTGVGKSHAVSKRHAAEAAKSQADLDNANWLPESVQPDEERLRYAFNRRIDQALSGWLPRAELAGALLEGRHPGELKKVQTYGADGAIDAVKDDLTLMFLTDYYRALDEIVHVDLLAKGDVSGHQLLASCCFLRDLGRHFPFQGNALGSPTVGEKSVARHYVQLLRRAWLAELLARLPPGNQTDQTRDGSTRDDSARQLISANSACDRLAEYAADANRTGSESITSALEKLRVPVRELEQIQTKIKKSNEVGLPSERHLKWKYCAGSEPYLRGHTCSLWILFHTLTVQEYLANRSTNNSAKSEAPPVEYKFQIDYAKPPKRSCDPSNPDAAYLASKPSELFVEQTKFAAANIINFVRYYLPCTNCAAHFSCMVEHSPGLHFEQQRLAPDDHLLWLWEAHNRVNERTRATHSEDPRRPKHIFPSYGACQQCYLEQPAANATLSTMRFDRSALVDFVVARYRQSAILNNQINIEALHTKP